MKRLIFKKIENKIWYSEYHIIFEGKYLGFIYKCKKEHPWNVFIPNIFQYPIRDCEFKTLREAKREIKKELERRYGENN